MIYTEEIKLTGKLSLLEKVQNMLLIAKSGSADESTVNQIADLTTEHSDHTRLGKFFGHSVSDYAFAVLKWLNNPYSAEVFNRLFSGLADERKTFINELISQEGYKTI